MTNLNPDQVLGRHVTAIYTDGREHDFGTAIAYHDVPSYEIERADGTRFAWRADMVLAGAAEAVAYWRKRAEAAEAKLGGAA